MVTRVLWSSLLNLNPPPLRTFSHWILKNYKIGPGEKGGGSGPPDAPAQHYWMFNTMYFTVTSADLGLLVSILQLYPPLFNLSGSRSKTQAQ